MVEPLMTPLVENLTKPTIENNLLIAQNPGGIFGFLNQFFDLIFGSLVAWSPLYGLIIISFILTLIITVAYKYLTDQNLMKEMKAKLKEYQKQMKENKGDTSKIMEIQKKAMEINMKYMMHSLKPSLFTLLPLILIFNWLRIVFEGIDLNFLGFFNGWIWAYIIVSIAFSIGLRKVLKVH